MSKVGWYLRRLFPSQYDYLYTKWQRFRNANSQKVFCIGRNKTGTTSMQKFFRQCKFNVGSQREAELLLKDYASGDFNRLIEYVKYGGVAFQDVPFSLPNTFKIMDRAFPSSKFILTVRDSPEEWYRSVTKFHAKKFGRGTIPTKHDLMNADYVYRGWIWESFRLVYDTPEEDLYNESILKKQYEAHNQSVIEYFSTKPNQLLVVNVKEENAAVRISQFLGIKPLITTMPWENKTSKF